MFSGIIEHCGIITAVNTQLHGIRLTIQSQFIDLQLGESIAVDGICLTVMAIEQQQFSCELSPETLAVTIANEFISGRPVNLERALRVSDRFGGHIVTGHVDGVVKVSDLQQQGEYLQITFTGNKPSQYRYLIPKGSICVNGVSLTLNTVAENQFSVMLIPHSLAVTNLSQLHLNSRVNIEFDTIAKIVVHNLAIQELTHV